MRRHFFILFFLAVLSTVVFLPIFDADFLRWDDDINIIDNPHIKELNAASVKWMFSDVTYTPRYRPLNWLTWTLTYHFFGLNPRPFHVVLLLMHVANVLLLYGLLLKILRKTKTDSANDADFPIVAAFAALLWGLHPLRVEVTAWVNCAMYTQSLLFALLSLYSYFRFVDGPGSSGWKNCFLWSSVILFSLSLLTYPTAISFVIVLLILDIFLFKKIPVSIRLWGQPESRRALLAKIPFVAVTLVVMGLALWVRTHVRAFWVGQGDVGNFPFIARVAQAFYIWAYYLWKPWFSFSWCPVYTQLFSFNPFAFSFVASAVVVLGGTVVLWVKRRKWAGALALWLCYLALLVPMLGLTEHPHVPSDRYSYICSIVWSVAFALVLSRIWDRSFLRLALCSAFVCCVTVFGVFSFQEAKSWKDSPTFFSAVIRKLGDNPYRSDLYWRLGNYFLIKEEYHEAEVAFAAAAKIAPNVAVAQQQLGSTLVLQKKFAEAEVSLITALRLAPESFDVHYLLAKALFQQGKRTEAEKHYREALRLKPDSAESRFQLGLICAQRNEMRGAVTHWREAVRLKPTWIEALNNLAWTLATASDASLRDGSAALRYAQSAATMAGKNDAASLDTLAAAFAELGQFAEAVQHEERAIAALKSNSIVERKQFEARRSLYQSNQPYRE